MMMLIPVTRLLPFIVCLPASNEIVLLVYFITTEYTCHVSCFVALLYICLKQNLVYSRLYLINVTKTTWYFKLVTACCIRLIRMYPFLLHTHRPVTLPIVPPRTAGNRLRQFHAHWDLSSCTLYWKLQPMYYDVDKEFLDWDDLSIVASCCFISHLSDRILSLYGSPIFIWSAVVEWWTPSIFESSDNQQKYWLFRQRDHSLLSFHLASWLIDIPYDACVRHWEM